VKFIDGLLAAGGGALGDVGLHPQLARFDGDSELALLLPEAVQLLTRLREVRHVHRFAPSFRAQGDGTRTSGTPWEVPGLSTGLRDRLGAPGCPRRPAT
jgi:hypothetical protein